MENNVREFGRYALPIGDDMAVETLDSLMHRISELLPVDQQQYPDVSTSNRSETIKFCLHHSALHFSKTAGRLAAFVEDADHGHFSKFQTLESIVAAGLVNSLKLADEIGLTGVDILEAVRLKFVELDQAALQTKS